MGNSEPTYLTRRELNKEEKRLALEGAALALFLDQGYHRTTIGQVVERAGVARGTFYLYFADKGALFRRLLDCFLVPARLAVAKGKEDLDRARTHAETQEAYLVLAATLSALAIEHRDAVVLYYREQRDPGPVGRWLRDWESDLEDMTIEIVRSLMERGLIRRADPLVVALGIFGAIDRLVHAYLSGRDLGQIQAIGLEVVRLFGEGLVEG